MAGDAVNMKFCSSLKLRSGMTRNYHAICHYSYNLPLAKTGEDQNLRKIITPRFALKKQKLRISKKETKNFP